VVDLVADEAEAAWHDVIDIEEAVLAQWQVPNPESARRSLREITHESRAAEAAAKRPRREQATTKPQRQKKRARMQHAAVAYPPGSRLAFLFDDGEWREGAVKKAPWPPGHKHQHWRRVRFEDGWIRDVDTAATGVGGRLRTAEHAPAASLEAGLAQPAEPLPAAVVHDLPAAAGAERGKRWRVAPPRDFSAAWDAASAGDSDEEWTAPARPEKGGGSSGAEEAAAEPGDAPRGRWSGVWEESFARLAAYTTAHGDCSVPQGWAEDPKLGQWVSKQRQRKKALDRGDPSPGMTAARAARLEALGFAWALSSEQISKQNRAGATDEAAWEAQLARLAAYKEAHGDCNVPTRWAEDPQLGSWVGSQRTRKKALDRGDPRPGMTVARAARLEALGFAWALSSEQISKQRQAGNTDEAAWEAQLARLAAYKVAHADCDVPQGWAEDPQLGKWVSKQRARKRKLNRGKPGEGMTAARAARLTALGLVWNLV
jgi:hypothetical protein